MTKGAFPVADVARPKTKIIICIFCGVANSWRRDRKGRYFFSCSDCRTRVFLHSRIAIAGMEQLHEMALRFGARRLRANALRRAGE